MSDYLQEELLIEILIRLPPKSVVRFRCVSKSWCSLISSPYFVYAYLNRTLLDLDANNTHPLLFRQFDHLQLSPKEHYSILFHDHTLGLDGFEIEFPFQAFNKFFRVVGSCNDLVCVSHDLYVTMNTVILWNLIINKSVKLPLPSVTNSKILFNSARLPISSYVIGLGFDPKTTDFKVMKLSYLEEDPDHFGLEKPPSVELYSLRLRSWRAIGASAPLILVYYHYSSQAFVDGTINWLAVDKNKSCCLILTFDLRDEVFGEVELPGTLVKENLLSMSIAEFGKSIVLFHYDDSRWTKRSIWVMKEYGMVESWTKLLTFDLVESEILFLRRNGEFIFSSHDGSIYTYNTTHE